MNNSTTAKNGFKTFILTLAISLVAFSVIYYVQTEVATKVSIENSDTVGQLNTDSTKKVAVVPAAVETAPAEASIFKVLADDKTVVAKRVVLGGATTTETTQSTVPATGITEITYAFILSISLTLFGAYLFIYEPRRKALLSFERSVKRDLN